MKPTTASRMYIVLFVLLASFIVVMVRAYILQIVRADELLARADWSSEDAGVIHGPRGAIVDRDGRPLAQSVEARDVVIDPRFFRQHEADDAETVRQLIEHLPGFDAPEFDRWLASEPAELRQWFLLARRLAPGDANEIVRAAQEAGLRSVYGVPSYRRIYPQRALAGRLVGYLQGDERAGLAGVELGYDDELRGRSARYEVRRDADRRPFLLGDTPDIRSMAGATVEVSIDVPIQRAVEAELAETARTFRPERLSVVVSRPQTGEILALASWPPFDPNHWQDYEAELRGEIAATAAYEPGSTMKMVTFAAALDSGVATYDEPIDCEGGRFRFGGATIEDDHPEEIVPAWKIVQVSSNIGAVKIGTRLSAERLRSYVRGFGFGQTTGAPIVGEAPGLLPALPWHPSRHATVTYGYGVSATALQVNMATAAIANGGWLMRPLMVREIRAADGTTIRRFQPERRRRVVSESAARLTAAALESATHEDGTGWRAVVPGFRVAGKTGTARSWDRETRGYVDEYLSSFTGFLPAESPELAITVFAYRPDKSVGHYGSQVAAPLFRRVAEVSLDLLGVMPGVTVVEADAQGAAAQVAPESLSREPVSSTVFVPGDMRGPAMPDLRRLPVYRAIERAQDAGLRVRTQGTGWVVEQAPAPGESLPEDGWVSLTLGWEAGGRDAVR